MCNSGNSNINFCDLKLAKIHLYKQEDKISTQTEIFNIVRPT